MCIANFEVKFKCDRGKLNAGHGKVYAIREYNSRTEFLIFYNLNWEWHDADEFVPYTKPI